MAEKAPKAAPAAEPASRVLGIDISDYQRRVDFDEVKRGGQEFVFIKATEGNGHRQTLFESHKAAALAAGLLVGAYHFARPDDSLGDAVAEARLMAAKMGCRQRDELPPVLDLEKTKTVRTASWARAFIEALRDATGERPFVYLGRWFLGPQTGEEAKALEWLGQNTRLWLPAYPMQRVDPMTNPRPKPFASWGEVTIHQFAGDASAATGNATIPGVVGSCDANVFFGSLDELRAIAAEA